MRFSKFIGGISKKDTHSNQYAAGTVSAQTFSERKQIEQSRTTIGAYRHSAIGQNFAPRGEYVRSKPRKYTKPERDTGASKSRYDVGDRSDARRQSAPRQQNSEPAAPTPRISNRQNYNPYA